MLAAEIAGAVIGLLVLLPIFADFLTGVMVAAGFTIEREPPFARWALTVELKNVMRRICGLKRMDAESPGAEPS
jgi:hypothetical protein